jgi:hypothetical protein
MFQVNESLMGTCPEAQFGEHHMSCAGTWASSSEESAFGFLQTAQSAGCMQSRQATSYSLRVVFREKGEHYCRLMAPPDFPMAERA